MVKIHAARTPRGVARIAQQARRGAMVSTRMGGRGRPSTSAIPHAALHLPQMSTEQPGPVCETRARLLQRTLPRRSSSDRQWTGES
eukprot:11140065-Alexandrium_andersonii.AAC.1